MLQLIRELGREQKGATAIEYGLIAALLAIAIIFGAQAIGVSLGEVFASVESDLELPASEF